MTRNVESLAMRYPERVSNWRTYQDINACIRGWERRLVDEGSISQAREERLQGLQGVWAAKHGTSYVHPRPGKLRGSLDSDRAILMLAGKTCKAPP